jgi:hypothetical protein
MSKTGGYDLSMLGSAGQMAAQQFASKVQDARWLMYGARMLLHPFQTIMYAIILIIMSIYITSNTSYKKSFGFLSFLLIAGTIGFTILKFVPNPAWVYTKPAVWGMSIVEKVEEETGLSADDVLEQFASGVIQIGSSTVAATAQPTAPVLPAPTAPVLPAPTAPVLPAINPQIEQQKREQEKLDDEARERYAGQQLIQENEIREQQQQALILGPPPPHLASDGFGYSGPPPVNATAPVYYEGAPPTTY